MATPNNAQDYQRFAVYFTPSGPLGTLGAKWLGWDSSRACFIEGADQTIVKRPQKYGFHATIKAPFHLNETSNFADLLQRFRQLCAQLDPVILPPLSAKQMGGILALKADGDMSQVNQLAAQTLKALTPFRAPLTQDALNRRRKSRLNAQQEAHLLNWGYPHVLDQFKFHITLSGYLDPKIREEVSDKATKAFAPALTQTIWLDHLSLMGERSDGMFEVIIRDPLNSKNNTHPV